MDVIISGSKEIISLLTAVSSEEFSSIETTEQFLALADKTSSQINTKEVKQSVFNYVVKKEDSVIIYNTLYSSLVRLDGKEYDEYLFNAQTCENNKKRFIECGIWIPSNFDEKKRFLEFSKAYTLFAPSPLELTITTTLKCNARCSYCYEKCLKQIDIFDNVEEWISKFVRERTEINEVRFIWFGGEPLMNTSCIDRISQRMCDLGISFSSHIITNGSLIDETILEKMVNKWNVENVQITLDGTEKNYEDRKRYINSEEGRFYKIINNIKEIAKRKIPVNIRLNIDRDNQKDILLLLKELDNIFDLIYDVSFYPAFLSGTKNPLNEDEKIDLIKKMIQSVKNPNKFYLGKSLYSLPKMNPCMNGDPKSFSIDVYGNIFSCEHFVGRERKKIGKIKESSFMIDDRGKNIELRKECETCVFLPKCQGGCEANYLENDSPCAIEKFLIKGFLEIL